jgi:hypothetical protein
MLSTENCILHLLHELVIYQITYLGKVIMNSDWVGTWNEAVVAYFPVSAWRNQG